VYLLEGGGLYPPSREFLDHVAQGDDDSVHQLGFLVEW